jgi:methylmalonyl-CoA mutase N-terminal domain/subunit
VLKEKYKARDPHSLKLRFHTQTSGYTLTWQQPLNNIIRTTTEALSAVLGGTQSLHTNSYDEALALPTEEAAKIALRTQQIIAYETGAAEVADPLGGSYYLENLTSRIELEAYEYFDKIEKLGGMLNAVKEGYPQKEIANSAYERQQRLEGGEDVMVGVNAYREENEKPINILRIDRKPEFVQKKRLGTVMSRRNQKKVNHALNRLRSAMNNERTNLVPYIMDAVVAYATLGEIANVGKEIYGEWKEPKIL